MKKGLIITFESVADDIQDCMIYSESVSPREDVITQEELAKSGLKKMMKLPLMKQLIVNKIGNKYQVRITAEHLKELFNF